MTILIFAHGDGDGVTSAALAMAALRRKYQSEEVRVFFSHPVGLYGDLKEQVKDDVRVLLILDIALDERSLEQLEKYLKDLSRRMEVVYIDHHPTPLDFNPKELPVKVCYSEDEPCTALLTYEFFKDSLDWKMSRVALYGAIADYSINNQVFNRLLSLWDIRLIFYEGGLLAQGLEGLRRMYDVKRRVVEELSRGVLPSQIPIISINAVYESLNEERLIDYVKKNLKIKGEIAYVLDPPGSVGKAANYARIIGGRIIGIAGETRKGQLVASLRTVRPKVDLNLILRNISRKLDVHGGGHRRAAGVRVKISEFKNFLKELNKELTKVLKS